MIKVLFLVENLNGGGAESVLVNLINRINKKEFDVTLVTMFGDGVNYDRLNTKDIRYKSRHAFYVKGMSVIYKFIPPKILYRYYIGKDKYDVVISYMHGLPTRVILGAKSSRKITWIHGYMNTGKKPQLAKYFITKNILKKNIEKLDACVCVSQKIKESFTDYTGVADKAIVLYNTNDVDGIIEKSKIDVDIKKDNEISIVTVGHLQSVKGNDRLLVAAKRLHDEGFLFDLNIIGEGNERTSLEAYINNNNMESYIKLLGFVKNPYPYVKASDIFVCPSRSEGLSTAVSEAVILGIPVVSTEVSGAHEILGDNNEYGIVCENNEEGIYSGLKSMISDAAIREHYSKKSAERAEFFNPQRTVGDVEELIMKIYNA